MALIDDIKTIAEIAAPIAGAVWYLRGYLVRIDAAVVLMGERISTVARDVASVEKDVTDLERWRLNYVTRQQRITRS